MTKILGKRLDFSHITIGRGLVTVLALLRYYPRLMQATRSRRLVRFIALFTVAFASCSDRDDALDDPGAGAGNAGSCTSCAGDDAGGSAAGGQGPAGGKSTLQPTAGKAGSASAGASADAGVGNNPRGEGGSGGATGPISEQLALCERLTAVSDKEKKSRDAFEKLAFLDCRVTWIPDLYLHPVLLRHEWQNAMTAWNLRFWGCEGLPVEDFQLVWQEPPLSRGDADILIDHYMQAAIEFLELSPKEQDEMRAALLRLSTVVVTSDSAEPSQPRCDDPNAGGAGGMSGAGGDGSSAGADSAPGGGGNGGAP